MDYSAAASTVLVVIFTSLSAGSLKPRHRRDDDLYESTCSKQSLVVERNSETDFDLCLTYKSHELLTA